MTKISNLHKRWIKNPSYRKAYAESSTEFEIAKEVIQARIKSDLSQEALAERMHTSQSKFTQATNSQIHVQFKPIKVLKHKIAT